VRAVLVWQVLAFIFHRKITSPFMADVTASSNAISALTQWTVIKNIYVCPYMWTF
jgi:hypothetical protein